MTPVEVLAAHREESRLFSMADEGFSIILCACGAELEGGAAHAAHVLDALAKAGHVVVDLPEPDIDNGRQKVWTSSIADVILGEYMGVLIDWSDADDSPTPDELRALAAALLAAAVAAEGGRA
ncbi:hypothetical protein ACFWQG_13165 [Rhodococcus sp. NPDC058532]|uniref:hypothetical protein n=1 Tax=Rhodococcus sp. NPDC058532 TaxID=3346540 RepID=UPI00364BC669